MLALLSNRLFLWIAGGGAIVAALFLAMNLGKAHGTIRGLKRDIVTTNEAWSVCRSDLAVQQAQNLELRGALDVQNAAVQDWKRRAEQVQSEADRRVAKARREAADYRAQARRVLAAKPQIADRCQAASQLYLEAVGGR